MIQPERRALRATTRSIIVALVLARAPIAAQQPAAPCFQLVFERDSLTAFLPQRIEWRQTSPRVRMFWDNPSKEAREFRRQTAGEARWARGTADSVTVFLLESLTENQIALRFSVRRDTLRGWLLVSGFAGHPDVPITGRPALC
jgi:hypothetical protein